jgi:putative glutamine amidotransferase
MPNVLSWIREKDETNFDAFFTPHPEVTLVNARRGIPDLADMDALLLTGGADICAAYLRQPVAEAELALIEEDAEADRDAFEFAALAAALERGLPILTVCKGTQVLNVALGGTLHLDIPGHDLPEMKLHNVQPLRFSNDATIRFDRVNSSHHQALDKIGSGLTVEAWCSSDGVVEQVRMDNYPFALGVQYHPERDSSYKPLFELFLDKVLKK